MNPSNRHLDLEQAWQQARDGDRAAIERVLDALSLPATRQALLGPVHAGSGNAHRVGLAGPPHAGKSTLLCHLARHYAARSDRVGIVSVDATGPGAQGNHLGDRMRRNALEMSDDILVRSVNVGPGGESPALLAGLAADGMDALGCDPVFLESIGMGRSQLEVLRVAHTIVLVVPPDVSEPERLVEAGLLLTADVVVVNKIDQEGATELVETLRRGAEAIDPGPQAWKVRILGLSALRGQGMEELLETLDAHRAHLRDADELSRRKRRAARVLLAGLVEQQLRERLTTDEEFARILAEAAQSVADRSSDPARLASSIAERFELKGDAGSP